MKRQVLSMLLFLCVAMALSLLPMSALAAESKPLLLKQAYRDYIQEDVKNLEQTLTLEAILDVNSEYR